jgi:glycerophosphoryl diester phosphodiesterase
MRTGSPENNAPEDRAIEGTKMAQSNADMQYPRIVAHRGFNTVAPENTMPAFGAAVALGADELEMDIWPTKDGAWIVCHDPTADRTSDGHGFLRDLTFDEIRCMDAGGWFSPHFKGLRFPVLEEVLRVFSGMAVFNIHVKSFETGFASEEEMFRRMVHIIDETQCRQHVYLAGDEKVLALARSIEPGIPRCCLAGKKDGAIVEKAIEYECEKIQITKGFPDENRIIKAARDRGIRCNLFWSDDPAEAERYLQSGIDAILTNDLLHVMYAVRKYQ